MKNIVFGIVALYLVALWVGRLTAFGSEPASTIQASAQIAAERSFMLGATTTAVATPHPKPTARPVATPSLLAVELATPTPAPTPPPPIAVPLCSSTACEFASSNWSGYIVGNGPYGVVTGTFTVPNIVDSVAETVTAEWVGIDGINTNSLIQAGVVETYEPTGNRVTYRAWWEILPAEPVLVPIDWNQVSVLPGHRVTVTIWQVGGPLWAIKLTDNTTGQSFTTEQSYSGPQASADWIVEVPTLAGATETLGEYSPAVKFSGLRITGSDTTTTRGSLVQGGAIVSVPSELTAAGFTVAYGAVAPAAP